MLYINIRLKSIKKAKVLNFLDRVSFLKTFYTRNYKKAGAALVRTITSSVFILRRLHGHIIVCALPSIKIKINRIINVPEN